MTRTVPKTFVSKVLVVGLTGRGAKVTPGLPLWHPEPGLSDLEPDDIYVGVGRKTQGRL